MSEWLWLVNWGVLLVAVGFFVQTIRTVDKLFEEKGGLDYWTTVDLILSIAGLCLCFFFFKNP